MRQALSLPRIALSFRVALKRVTVSAIIEDELSDAQGR